MFDSSLAVPLHFTVEFVGFLVAAGGAFLVASRPSLVPGEPGRRRLVALGFFALAVAHVVHGGAFVAADGDEVLTLVRAMGFAVMLVGLVGRAVPAGASAGATFQVKDPLPLVPAAMALLAAAAAFAGSFRGGPKTHRRLAVGLFLFAIDEVLVSVAPSFEFGVGRGNQFAYLSHLFRLLGYVAIGSWLWSGVRSSIRTRFVASFVALLVVVVLALSTALTGVISNQVEGEQLKRLDVQLGTITRELRGHRLDLLNGIQSVAEATTVRATMLNGGSLQRLANNLVESVRDFYEADFIVMDTPRQAPGSAAIGRKLKGAFVVQVTGSDLLDELEASRGSGSTVGTRQVGGSIVILAVAEVPDPTARNRVLGTVVLGRTLGASWVEGISAGFAPARASLVVGGRTAATTLPRALRRQDLVPQEIQRQLAGLRRGESVSARQAFGNQLYFSAYAPITNESTGERLAVVVLSSPARIVADTREDVTKALFLVAMAAAAVALALAWYSGRRITRPIQQLTSTARAIREGDLAAQAPVAGPDEVGQLGETFNEMTLSLLRLTEDLRLSASEEQQLRGRIETIIESMADGLVAVDAKSEILAFNRQAQHLTGLSPREALGEPIDEVITVHNANGDAIRLPVHELAAGSTSGVFIHSAGEDPVPVAVTSAVLRDDAGDVAGAVAVIRDMTREREIERMKSEFLSNISHELRTPLTPIKGYAEILTRKEVPPDKIKRFTQGILDSTSRLERIVELLVDFSAMEAGRLAPKSTPVDIAGMVRKLGEETGARSPRHEVVTDIKARLPKIVGDERLLWRSLQEVVDNAVKFSPDGGTIKLEVRGVSAGNGRPRRRSVAVTVADQGIGIEPENLDRIFSDFHQLDGSETRAYGGLGLGLAFVQRIVEAHQGQVDVDSQPREGTRFTITLPGAGATAAD